MNNNPYKIFKYKWVRHLLYWLLAFVLVYLLVNGNSSEKNQFIIVKEILFLMISWAIPIYLHYFFALKHLYQSQYIKYGLWVISIVVSASYININVSQWLGIERGNYGLSSEIINIFLLLIIITGLTFIFSYAQERRIRQEQELRLLKAQLNPHFLFNTLNNLYGLSVIKSDKLPDLMLKLSELLRYMLYEANGEVVTLQKEIHYIENYVYLESLRLGERAEVSIHCEGDFSHHEIAPMLLITFVENAFKHLSAGIKKTAYVKIIIKLKGRQLLLLVENSKDEQHLLKKRKTGGIGLDNIKKRLRLQYIGRYNLQITDKDGIYAVNLRLMLD